MALLVLIYKTKTNREKKKKDVGEKKIGAKWCEKERRRGGGHPSGQVEESESNSRRIVECKSASFFFKREIQTDGESKKRERLTLKCK